MLSVATDNTTVSITFSS